MFTFNLLLALCGVLISGEEVVCGICGLVGGTCVDPTINPCTNGSLLRKIGTHIVCANHSSNQWRCCMPSRCEPTDETCPFVEPWNVETTSAPMESDPVDADDDERKIFVIGGYYRELRPPSEEELRIVILKSAEMFDFANRTWTRVADVVDTLGRGGVSAATLGGRVYTVGHLNLNLYDPATDKWSPPTRVSRHRGGYTMAALGDRLYIVGGDQSAEADVFDPISNGWASIANMTTMRRSPGVGVLNGDIYAVGGGQWKDGKFQALATAEKYSAETGEWSPVASMERARYRPTVESVGGKLYAIGGRCQKSVEAYDPMTDRWSRVADMSTDREGAGSVSRKGLIYVIGGVIDHGRETANSMEIYNPKTNTWTLPSDARLGVSRYLAGVALA